MQSSLVVTRDHIVQTAGVGGPMGNHPHQVFVYDRAGELVSSFYPSYPMQGDDGLAQNRAVVVRRGQNLLVVNAAPLEVVEYAFPSGRELRTIVEPDSTMLQAPGEEYRFEVSQRWRGRSSGRWGQLLPCLVRHLGGSSGGRVSSIVTWGQEGRGGLAGICSMMHNESWPMSLYAFDLRRIAILLIGGDRTGRDRWYEGFVPKADDLYDEHLEILEQEGLI